MTTRRFRRAYVWARWKLGGGEAWRRTYLLMGHPSYDESVRWARRG